MKFKSEVEIAKSMDELIVLIQDPENTLKWLDGLRSVKHISGELRQAGAISKVVFDSPAGRLHITETVISNELPHEYIIRYDGIGYTSYSNYTFQELSDGLTRFTMLQQVELKGALKLAGGLVKGKMSRQLSISAEGFKRFAENQ
ncbi:MAG: carbon monoxide dehydrogenase subunit G [Bacteroidia bacterium]|jgi:carbon monoxide dehydrogenase subunit G